MPRTLFQAELTVSRELPQEDRRRMAVEWVERQYDAIERVGLRPPPAPPSPNDVLGVDYLIFRVGDGEVE
jgi:hypothetical protein